MKKNNNILKNNIFDSLSKDEIYDLITYSKESFLIEHRYISEKEYEQTKEFIKFLLK